MKNDGKDPSYNSVLAQSPEQGAMLVPLLEEKQQDPASPKFKTKKQDKISNRLWRIRSAPPVDIMDINPNRRPKLPTLALKSMPPPSHFSQQGSFSLARACLGLLIYLIVGILSFTYLEADLEGSSTSTLVDALYFAIVTMTTVGYGDLVPRNTGAKLFTCAFVFVGFGLIGVLVSGAANYLVEKQEKILVQKVYLKYRKRGETAEIVPGDNVVAAHWKAGLSGALVGILFIVGVVVLVYCEGLSLLDAFYCVCVTVTTLGYGDQSFHTRNGRIFAIFWILSSTACVAQFFLYLAEMKTEERQHELAHWALNRPTTKSDLAAADIDGDGVVSAAEFVIYKLKECGKLEETDVLDVLKEFRSLDHDQSGTLSVSDIRLSQLLVVLAHLHISPLKLFNITVAGSSMFRIDQTSVSSASRQKF